MRDGTTTTQYDTLASLRRAQRAVKRTRAIRQRETERINDQVRAAGLDPDAPESADMVYELEGETGYAQSDIEYNRALDVMLAAYKNHARASGLHEQAAAQGLDLQELFDDYRAQWKLTELAERV